MSDKATTFWLSSIIIVIVEIGYATACILINGESPKWYGFITFPIGLAIMIALYAATVWISTGGPWK